jgi:hypothetical protein
MARDSAWAFILSQQGRQTSLPKTLKKFLSRDGLSIFFPHELQTIVIIDKPPGADTNLYHCPGIFKQFFILLL